jgi:hypothetical protein
LDIYLDGNPRRAVSAAPAPMVLVGEFREIQNVMASFKDATDPRPGERAEFWKMVFLTFKEKALAMQGDKTARILLVNFLWNSAGHWIAKSKNALRITFRREMEKGWAGKSHYDGRNARKGIPTKPLITEQEAHECIGLAVFRHGGRLAPAVRELAEEMGVEAEFVDLLARHQGNIQESIEPIIKLDAAKILTHARGLIPAAESGSREMQPTAPLLMEASL